MSKESQCASRIGKVLLKCLVWFPISDTSHAILVPASEPSVAWLRKLKQFPELCAWQQESVWVYVWPADFMYRALPPDSDVCARALCGLSRMRTSLDFPNGKPFT